MNNEEFEIHRIVITLDAGTECNLAVEAAAHMAARLRAELLGLFVEDEQLLALEDNPAVEHLSLPGGHKSQLPKGSVERGLRAMALQARRALEQASRRWQLPWSFQVTRGRLDSEIAAGSEHTDLVVIETSGRRVSSEVRLRTASDKVDPDLERSVLCVRKGLRPVRSVVVLYDGSPESRRALGAARRLAETDGIMLTILAPRTDEDGDLTEELESRVPHAAQIHLHRITDTSAERLASATETVHGDLFLLGAASRVPGVETLEDFVDELSCPVLLVR